MHNFQENNGLDETSPLMKVVVYMSYFHQCSTKMGNQIKADKMDIVGVMKSSH